MTIKPGMLDEHVLRFIADAQARGGDLDHDEVKMLLQAIAQIISADLMPQFYGTLLGVMKTIKAADEDQQRCAKLLNVFRDTCAFNDAVVAEWLITRELSLVGTLFDLLMHDDVRIRTYSHFQITGMCRQDQMFKAQAGMFTLATSEVLQ